MLQVWQNFDRGILNGIAAYVREGARWSVYVEEEKQQRIPDLREWNGDGLIVNFAGVLLKNSILVEWQRFVET